MKIKKMEIGNREKGLLERALCLFVITSLIISLVPFSAAAMFGNPQQSTFSANPQYFEPGTVDKYGSDYNRQNAGPSFSSRAGNDSEFYDLMVTIPPLGCEPKVVRSDLLEEQNVPVYCKLASVSVNPGVDISRIGSMKITQKTRSEYVAGVGFKPAQAAIRSRGNLVNTPIGDNLGLVYVVLKRQETEAQMPDNVSVVLSASLDYNAENTFGIGQTEFYLPVLSDSEFENTYKDYGFWKGIGYLRAEAIDDKSAVISVYDSSFRKVHSSNLVIGKRTGDIHVPTSTGGQGLKITLKQIALPQTKAKIKVNGEEYEVYQNSRFSEKGCKITRINAKGGGTGSVRINCKGQNFDLEKEFENVLLDIEGKGLVEFEIGEDIRDDDKYEYIAYSGIIPETVPEQGDSGYKGGDRYVLLVNTVILPKAVKAFIDYATMFTSPVASAFSFIAQKTGTGGYTDTYNEISEVELGAIKRDIARKIKGIRTDANFLEELQKISPYSSNLRYSLVKPGEPVLVDNPFSDETVKGYYDKAIESYDELIEVYGSESYYSSTYGQQALCNQFLLAKELKQKVKQRQVLHDLIEKYPYSSCGEKNVQAWLADNTALSDKDSTALHEDENIYFELVSVTNPGVDDASVQLTYSGAKGTEDPYTFFKREQKEMADSTKLTLKSFDEDAAIIGYSCRLAAFLPGGEKGTLITKSVTIKQGEYADLEKCNARIFVDKINLNKVAKVQLTPKTFGRSRTSDFTFNIGIEKRADLLDLTPEQSLERIKKLNETIKEWEEINEDLSNTIEGLKATCLVTSLALQIKTLFSGFDGTSTARRDVIDDIWNIKCSDTSYQQANGFTTTDGCLLGKGSEIEKDVEARRKAMQDLNKVVKENEDSLDQKGILTKTVSTEDSKELFVQDVKQTVPGLEGVAVDDLSYEQWKELWISYELTQTGESSLSTEGKSVYDKTYDSITKELSDKQKERSARVTELEKTGLKAEDVSPLNLGKVTIREYNGKTYSDYSSKLDGVSANVDDKVELREQDSKIYFYVLTGTNENLYTDKLYWIKDGSAHLVYDKDGFKQSTIAGAPSKRDVDKLRSVKFTEQGSYNNKIINFKDTGAKFFANEPYKGMPSLIPFDKEKGWYVKVEQLMFGGKSYAGSGAPLIYWICNVGENGMIEVGTDDCQRFDVNQNVNNILGLEGAAAQTLATKARNAILEAKKQLYNNPNKKSIWIDGMELPVKNIESFTGTKCTDFMSAKDCKILFNVCDPVVCPSSRCDMGGAFRVDDVIQSGVIGSVALCLPNFREGIWIPVCLTGIHAGIEGWMSILKAYRDCLQESIDSGKMTGICDEIHSVYVCDFWWKQLGPYLNALLKNAFAFLMGEGVHGGGEYMFISNAFDNAESSFAYFTNTYAATSKLGFGAKSFAELGSEICKLQASATYPDDFDAVLEPESPYQVNAWFDEMSYTDSTAVPQSQYKVFYHIFAGNDQGSYYRVYLKSPSGTIGSVGKSEILVDSGYIAKGETISETKDFLDISGFKRLCVRINTKDHCGFKSVSTSFAQDYLKDKVIEDELDQTITSEKDCVSGKPNIGNMLTPNLQQGIEDTIDPQLYNKGVTRVCATTNPGGSASKRWEKVGYCDNENIGCWVDTQSVKDSLNGKGVEEQALKNIEENAKRLADGETDYDTEKEIDAKILNLKNKYGWANDKNEVAKKQMQLDTIKTNFIAEVDAIEKRAIFNYHKAELIYFKAQFFEGIARMLYTNPNLGEDETKGGGYFAIYAGDEWETMEYVGYASSFEGAEELGNLYNNYKILEKSEKEIDSLEDEKFAKTEEVDESDETVDDSQNIYTTAEDDETLSSVAAMWALSYTEIQNKNTGLFEEYGLNKPLPVGTKVRHDSASALEE